MTSDTSEIYEIVEAYQTLDDGTKRKIKIQIQQVPNVKERHAEIIEHMEKYYMKDEPIAKSLAKDGKISPEFLEDFKNTWEYFLSFDMSIAAYSLDSSNEIQDLIGFNILYIDTPEMNESIEETKAMLKSKEFLLIYKFFKIMGPMFDMRKVYNVKDYLASVSLSVHPLFRGQKLGVHLLKFREKLGLKYGVHATWSIFSACSSQIQAKRAGFEENVSKDFVEIVDENGEQLFPNIESKCAKIMSRKLP